MTDNIEDRLEAQSQDDGLNTPIIFGTIREIRRLRDDICKLRTALAMANDPVWPEELSIAPKGTMLLFRDD